jgi:hypothetical protein
VHKTTFSVCKTALSVRKTTFSVQKSISEKNIHANVNWAKICLCKWTQIAKV